MTQRPVQVLERLREWWRRAPSPLVVRRTFLAALAANIGIVVTGAGVRLTASGLGCPTFPRCTDTSLVVTRQMGAHGVVEFTNRMLTFVLTAVVIVAVVTAWRARRRDLRRAALALFAGIVAQALLGGITVLTGLNPVSVMAHFLLSMVLIAVATWALQRAQDPADPADSPVPHRALHPALVLGGRAIVVVAGLLLVAGTVVTGTGPHSGDIQVTRRLPFNIVDVTQLHADLVFLIVGLTLGVALALRVSGASGAATRRTRRLLIVLVLQGVVGYLQYFTGVPAGLVAVHVLGACLTWVAALQLALSLSGRASDPARTARDGARGKGVRLPAGSGRL